MSRLRKIMYTLGGSGSDAKFEDFGLYTRYRSDLPQAFTDTDGHNTVYQSGGVTYIISFEDTSGRGKRKVYPIGSAPAYDPVTQEAVFTGGQLSDVVDLGFVVTTFAILTDAPVDGVTFMHVNSISSQITALGNYTGAVTAETYIVVVNPGDYLATDTIAPSGMKLIAHTAASAGIGTADDAGIYFDGAPANLITDKKTTNLNGSSIRFGSNPSGTSILFSGRVKEWYYGETPLLAPEHATLKTLMIL